MGRFLYTEPALSDSGPPSRYTIEVGAVDFMFILGALEELTKPENWDIQAGVISSVEEFEQFQIDIADYWENTIQQMTETEEIV